MVGALTFGLIVFVHLVVHDLGENQDQTKIRQVVAIQVEEDLAFAAVAVAFLADLMVDLEMQ